MFLRLEVFPPLKLFVDKIAQTPTSASLIAHSFNFDGFKSPRDKTTVTESGKRTTFFQEEKSRSQKSYLLGQHHITISGEDFFIQVDVKLLHL